MLNQRDLFNFYSHLLLKLLLVSPSYAACLSSLFLISSSSEQCLFKLLFK